MQSTFARYIVYNIDSTDPHCLLCKVYKQISLHDASHRAARYHDNFLDFMRTFVGTRIVLLAAY